MTTPVLKLAVENPSLAYFLTLLCESSELKASIQLVTLLTKCVLFIALGPRGDQKLDEVNRQKSRAQAIEWSISRLESLKSDSIQSATRFQDHPEYSPLAQSQMMTDLGFSQTELSTKVFVTLVAQLQFKLEKVDTLILSNERSLLFGAQNVHIKAPKFSAQKYVLFRRSLSLKCVPLLDNANIVRPLLEQLILSPARSAISNTFVGSAQTGSVSSITPGSTSSETKECICGLATELIDRLWANAGLHFKNFPKHVRVQLLHQCPAALSNEITRIIKSVNTRFMASRTSIRGLAADLIDAGAKFAPVFVHITAVLRKLILASMHPFIIRLYQTISTGVHSSLKTEKSRIRFIPNFSLYWHSSLTHTLSQDPQDMRHYKMVNLALETAIHAKIWTHNSELSSEPPALALIRNAWFTILAFPKWVDSAYLYLSQCDLADLEDESSVFDVLRFLSFVAHPMSHEQREGAIESLKQLLPRLRTAYSTNSIANSDLISVVLDADPVVHPLLLQCWDPLSAPPSVIFGVISEILARKPPTITLDTILCFLEDAPQTSRNETQAVVRQLWLSLENSPAISENKDVKLRFESLLA